MEIFIQNEAPPELIRIIDQVYDGIENINNVVIGTAIPELAEKKALGAFEPVTGTVIIDLQNCLTDKRWMYKGSLFIPNVWFNLMFAVHHELVHACQILDNPSLITAEVMPPELEVQANQMAQDAVWSWFDQGGKIPSLAGLGWIGKQIARTMNGLVSRVPESVIEERDMLEVAQNFMEFFEDELAQMWKRWARLMTISMISMH